MRMKFSLYALGAILLLVCAPLRCQNFVNQELGVSMQFEGNPTPDPGLTKGNCTTFSARSKELLERLMVCDINSETGKSDAELQNEFVDALKSGFLLAVDRPASGNPPVVFSGGKIVDPDYEGAWVWGGVATAHFGRITRVYELSATQMVPVHNNMHKFKKMADRAWDFVHSFRLLNQPSGVSGYERPDTGTANSTPQPSTYTQPDTSSSETLADLPPPATQQETDYYNKLKAKSPEKVNAFIETRKWFRAAYAQNPNFRYQDIDMHKMPPLPKGYSSDFTFTNEEKLLGIYAYAFSLL